MNELSASVAGALLTLNDADRVVVRLVYFDHLTRAQAADRLALSPSAVSQALWRGLRAVADTVEAVSPQQPGLSAPAAS